MFRSLKASEIECRVQSVNDYGFILLLYKDARCDMMILDETVGPMNWQRNHVRDNHNCIVSIWDKDKEQWISKEDTGTESNTERAKGLASDSFKRACFNWGIGRELYTGPKLQIWSKRYTKNGNKIYESFKVKSINTVDGVIQDLEIIDSKGNYVFVLEKGKVAFCMNDRNQPQAPKQYPKPPKQQGVPMQGQPPQQPRQYGTI